MNIVTWNVNSLRPRLERVRTLLEEHAPDVVCLQETKVVDELFPRDELLEMGYTAEVLGQKTYNGVAILAREPLEDVVRGLDDERFDDEARVIGARIGDVRVLDLYVVNGQRVGSVKYRHKLAWMERLHDYVHERFDPDEKLIVCGDFNCTFDDRDVHDPEAWRDSVPCSEPERDALAQLMSLGLRDAYRRFHEEAGQYTWWDFRTRGFERGRGLRIDHFLMSLSALEACRSVEILHDYRAGEKPSDHAPVLATLAD
ncbi:MAG: exodeoxyribonuclease III [bacterium]|nr:exodeoxyribonuclease III [bacterium]